MTTGRFMPRLHRLVVGSVTCLGTGLVALAAAASGTAGSAPAAVPRERWTANQAWAWYKKQPWIVGFNYVPSTAANTTEF